MPLLSARRITTAVAACVAWLLVPSVAFAGTAQLDDPADGPPHFTFTAASGEANRLLFFLAHGGYRVVDLGAAITAGPGCSAVSSSEVLCQFALNSEDDLATVDILLGDLNDFASLGDAFSAGTTVAGEDGSDELEVGLGCCNQVLLGGPGGDILRSSTGVARMDGGEGGDVIEGIGTLDYSSRVNSVFVDADGVADDGEIGEGDNVVPGVGFFEVVGGSAADTFTGVFAQGGDGNDIFFGTADFDFFDGGSGEDELNGGGRADELYGGSGADTIRGGPGGDFLLGEGGKDLLIGGDGHDSLIAGAGADEIRARDGLRDRIRGDGGFDRARVDRRLDVASSIEAFF